MEQYLQKTRLAGFLDGLGLKFMVFVFCNLWFILLWGVTWPAVLAGMSLGIMVLLAIRLGKKRTVDTREKQLRQRIGGELAMEALLMAAPRKAHFQGALWLSVQYPLQLVQAKNEGVICTLEKEKLLVCCLNHHPSDKVSCGDIILCKKAGEQLQTNRVIICCTADPTQDATRYAQDSRPPVRIISKEQLMRLAGVASPATDAQLVKLGQRRKRKASRKEWIGHILSPHRTRRYFLYGLGLMVMAYVTKLTYYPVPGVICICLGVLSRCYKQEEEPL